MKPHHIAAAAALVLSVVAAATPAAAVGEPADAGLLVWYPMTETTGTGAANAAAGSAFGAATVVGGAGRTADGVRLDGVDDYVDLPDNLLTGLTDVTVSIDVLVDTGQATPYFIYGLGNATTGDPAGYLFTTGNAYRSSITTGNWRTEQTVARSGNLTRGVWKTLTYTLSGTTATLFEDGVQVAQNTGVTVDPGTIGGGVTADNWIGRSLYAADKRLKGQVRDFRLYDRALAAADVAALAAPTSTAAVEADLAALTLGDTGSVLGDLALPASGAQGSAIAWASSDPAVVSNAGRVTRPPAGSPPAQVTLTATLTRGALTRTRAFAVTVVPAFDDATAAQHAVAQVSIPNLGDVRGNLRLPAALEGVGLTWSSSNPAVIGTGGEVSRPAAGSPPATVTLTVTGRKGDASASRDLVATVPALPAVQDPFGYLMVHFVEDANGYKEKIYLSLSRGEDPTRWYRLNGGEPILASGLGTTGVRDPYLVRSPEGDKFWIIATDLRVFGGDNAGWTEWSRRGSRSLLVWESTDLVHWSDTRLVQVAPPTAGMAWAPEVIYDDTTGEYVVFWSSTLFAETDTGHTGATYSRILYAKTRDFVTFTPAQVLIDNGGETIDTTMIRAGGKVFRFSKDNSSAGREVFGEVGSGVFATDFAITQTRIGRAQYGSVEGPLVFKDSYADKWYLYVDRYGAVQGYAPLVSTDMAAGWSALGGTFELPAQTKHGAVIALRGDEWERLAGVQTASVDAVSATTPAGVRPDLPAAVTVHLSDGSAQQRRVTWRPADVTRPGSVTVTGDVIGTGVTATATVTVTGVPLTVGAQSRCIGSTAYVAVTAVNAGTSAVTVTLTTPYGSKTVADVAPGKQAYQSFNARTGQLPAGTATVTTASGSYPAPYPAITCN
ncbi:immunoglobulin-like domain-containing protein [Dactylosporangium sp. AC04546]|uniref:immunoglobulin-like domain-containing protein n=1 Tax=Dactylosporangium sp. AC04546 TaxID=2862460 RepID=UPI001EDD0520|nr:immunoglobulin-like domain-containing protein [Dactylosporangium sp. AC04546]WVK86307.1 immunoglobulin-like domain-containing protein [Dactylosporangium sp. AC04546]